MNRRILVAVMSAAQIGSLLPHVVVPAVMPAHLIPEWNLSYSEAGLMAASYPAGYMLAVPVLTTLTDRIDARWILFWGSLVSGLATILFGLLANGLVSAILFWGLAGIGFAGAYMPGLKALTDRLDSGDASRSVTLYTASFSVGVGVSFLVSQLVAQRWGWRPAFLITGIGPAAMAPGCACAATGSAAAADRAATRFPTGAAQSRGAGLYARLRCALLRTIRDAHLARRVLGLRRHAGRRRGAI